MPIDSIHDVTEEKKNPDKNAIYMHILSIASQLESDSKHASQACFWSFTDAIKICKQASAAVKERTCLWISSFFCRINILKLITLSNAFLINNKIKILLELQG